MAEYLVPKSAVVFEEEIKKSRFITYLQHTEGLEDARAFWAKIKQEHPNARHHCWAAVAGKPTDSLQLGFSDDGEPAGTAGKPMLSALQGSQLGEISAVVVRYYGGVNLGTGGLIVAYRTAAALAIDNAPMVSRLVEETVSFAFPYVMMNGVMRVVKESEARILATNFENTCEIKLSIVRSKAEELRNKLNKLSFG